MSTQPLSPVPPIGPEPPSDARRLGRVVPGPQDDLPVRPGFEQGFFRPRFTKLMDRFMPNWRSLRDQLNSAPLAEEQWV